MWHQDQTWRSWDTPSIDLLPGENTGQPRTTCIAMMKWLLYWTMPFLQRNPGTPWQTQPTSTCRPRNLCNPTRSDHQTRKTYPRDIEYRQMPPRQNMCQHGIPCKMWRWCPRSRCRRCICNTAYPWLHRRNRYRAHRLCRSPSRASPCKYPPSTPRTAHRPARYIPHCTHRPCCPLHLSNRSKMGTPGRPRFQPHPCRCREDISCSHLAIQCSLRHTFQRNRSRHRSPWQNICRFHTQCNP